MKEWAQHHMLIDSKKRCTKTSLGLCGHGMHSAVASGPNNNCGPPPPNFPNFVPHLHMYNNSVRVHPYAHPQHMKVLKHFIYLQYGCGMQFGTSCSLNHDTTTSFGSTLPHLNRCYSVRVHPYAHPQYTRLCHLLN